MSGPSVKIPVDWLDRDQLEDLGSDVVMLMISALGHSARQTSDGMVPRRALRKLWPVPDVDAAVARLVEVGEVEDQGEWLLFRQWREFILPEDEVDRIKSMNRQRDERRRRHNKGDHSLCLPKYCAAASRESHVSDHVGDHVGSRVAHVDPTRPDPTRPLGRGGGVRRGGSAGATPLRHPAEGTPPRPGDAGHQFHLDPQDVNWHPDLHDDPAHPCLTCGLFYGHIIHHTHTFKTNGDGTCEVCSEGPENFVHSWRFQHDPPCVDGWVGDDQHGRPVPCSHCRSHLTRSTAGHLTVLQQAKE